MDLSRHEAAVARIAGVELVKRAIGYARGGAVRDVRFDNTGDVITAKVQGTGTRPYSTRVILTRGRGDSIEDFIGVCSCPVHDDCKHAVAVLLNALPTIDPPGHSTADWREALQTLRRTADTRPPSQDEPPPVALQFAVTEYGVTIRPVARGRKGNWIRSGISWSSLDSLRYSPSPRARSSHRVLTDLCSLAFGGPDYGYSYRPTEVSLADVDSPRLWDVLAEATRIGVPFVSASNSDDPVTVHATALTASLDVNAHAGGAVVAPRLSWDGDGVETAELDDVDLLLIGMPSHGVAWIDGGGLHLAPLSAGDVDVRQLLDLGSLHVPAVDVDEFLEQYAPALQAAVPVVSSDGSVDVPELGPPDLVLHLAYTHGHLELSWSWRSRSSSGPGELIESLDAHAHGGSRDPDRSRAVLDAATAACSTLAQLLDGDRLAPFATVSGSAMIKFASDVLPVLEAVDGVCVEQRGDPFEIREASESLVELAESHEDGPSAARDWLDLTVTITVDGEQVAFSEVFRAAAAGEPVMILPSGTWFSLDRPDFRELADLIAESRLLHDAEADTIRLTRYQASALDSVARNIDTSALPERVHQWQRSLRALARPDESQEPPTLPESFRAELRKYQRSGFDWLVRLFDHGLGGVLADEMGLGKTVQCLALFCHARERAPGAPPFLVVAPTSVVSNWASEAARFAPHLRVAVVTATTRRRGVTLADIAADVDVVVTSYALFRIDHAEYDALAWTGLILDEAQFVKNHRSQVHKCAAKLRAPFTLVITGTPMENNLSELWAMFSLAAPGLFPNLKAFEKYYRTPIEKTGDVVLLHQLRQRIKPFMLRRTKAEVVTDLPAKQEQVLELDLDPAHRRAYLTLLARERRKVMGLLSDLDRNQFEILRSLTILRQASLDISLVDETQAKVPSTKLDEVVRMLEEISSAGHRVIVFSQFTRFLGRVRTRLDHAGVGYAYLDGRTKDRGAVVTGFKTGNVPVFLISLKAGGFGLNLTEADYCFLLDPWWNGAAEAQAVDRVHRIGQTKPVTVYRLVARDTIEQKVMAVKEGKAALVASIMDGDEWSGSKLSADDIRELLA